MSSQSGKKRPEKIIGWREWLALPELNISWIKAKIDTGARSSALHAYDIETFDRDQVLMVRFKVHPIQRNTREVVCVELPVHDQREVRSSTGHAQQRLVIRPHVRLDGKSWPIDITLTNRDTMGFRMLLGREALRNRFLIDPARSFIYEKPSAGDEELDEYQQPDI